MRHDAERAAVLTLLEGLGHYSAFTKAGAQSRAHLILGTLEMNGYEVRKVES